jgi:hypothetical protein
MPPPARLARRRFLGALAAAPAALAGCAGAGGAAAGSGAEPRAGGSAPGAPPPDAATRAVRGLALSPEAEPAFVFRAGAARPGEP